MGRSVTGISLLTTEFGVSLVHWDWTDSPVGSKYEMVDLIEDNFVRRTDVSSPTFELIKKLLGQMQLIFNETMTHKVLVKT